MFLPTYIFNCLLSEAKAGKLWLCKMEMWFLWFLAIVYSLVSASYALGTVVASTGGNNQVQDLLDFIAERGQKAATKYLRSIRNVSSP